MQYCNAKLQNGYNARLLKWTTNTMNNDYNKKAMSAKDYKRFQFRYFYLIFIHGKTDNGYTTIKLDPFNSYLVQIVILIVLLWTLKFTPQVNLLRDCSSFGQQNQQMFNLFGAHQWFQLLND